MHRWIRTFIGAAALSLAALPGCDGSEETPAAAEGTKTDKPAPAPMRTARIVTKNGEKKGGQASPAHAADPHGGLPAGHPPTGQAGLPVGHPPTGQAGLPAGHPPTGQAGLPAGHPPAGQAGLPAGHPPAGQAGAAAGGGRIEGTITLDPSLKDQVKPGSVLFLMARSDAGEGKKGMLLAAKKIEVSGPDIFPLKYEISGDDVMMQGTRFAGTVRVEARIDQDGDAISKTAGDIVGQAAGAHQVGAAGAVDFTLDAKL